MSRSESISAAKRNQLAAKFIRRPEDAVVVSRDRMRTMEMIASKIMVPDQMGRRETMSVFKGVVENELKAKRGSRTSTAAVASSLSGIKSYRSGSSSNGNDDDENEIYVRDRQRSKIPLSRINRMASIVDQIHRKSDVQRRQSIASGTFGLNEDGESYRMSLDALEEDESREKIVESAKTMDELKDFIEKTMRLLQGLDEDATVTTVTAKRKEWRRKSEPKEDKEKEADMSEKLEEKDTEPEVVVKKPESTKEPEVVVKKPETPKEPEVLKELETPKEPEVLKELESPKNPEVLKEPETPKKLEVFQEPETLKNLEVLKEPETPKKLEVLKEPETPKNLEVLKEPETPKNLEDLKEPETPKNLEILKEPEPEKPVAVKAPEELKKPVEPKESEPEEPRRAPKKIRLSYPPPPPPPSPVKIARPPPVVKKVVKPAKPVTYCDRGVQTQKTLKLLKTNSRWKVYRRTRSSNDVSTAQTSRSQRLWNALTKYNYRDYESDGSVTPVSLMKRIAARIGLTSTD